MRVWSRLLEAIDRHGGAAMVTVAATAGSAPREAGARMIVNPDGSFTGTIGGGTLEWKAIALAQGRMTHGATAEVRSFALGPELGQCCGGRVDLLFETFGAEARDAVAALAAHEAAGAFATSGRVAAHGVVRTVSDEAVPPGLARYEAGILHEGFGDERRPLLLFGAGHVGRALVLALAPLPFTVTWVDPRPDAFPSHVPTNVSLHRTERPAALFAGASAGAFVVVMTHSHALDLDLVAASLRDGRFPYVGLIGSDTKRARFEKRLAALGLPAARIASLVCPIGIRGIDSKLPAAIAAATVAELLVKDEAIRAVGSPEMGLFVRHAAS